MIDCSKIYDKYFPVSFIEKKEKGEVNAFGYVFANDHKSVIAPEIDDHSLSLFEKVVLGMLETLNDDNGLVSYLKSPTNDDELEYNFVFNFFHSLSFIVNYEREIQVTDFHLFPFSELSDLEFYDQCLSSKEKRMNFVNKVNTFVSSYQLKKPPIVSGINPYRLNSNYRFDPSKIMQSKLQKFSIELGGFMTTRSCNITNIENVFGGAHKFRRLEVNLSISCLKYFITQLHLTIGDKTSVIKAPKKINARFLTDSMVLVSSTTKSNTYTPVSYIQFRNNKPTQCGAIKSDIDNAILSLS